MTGIETWLPHNTPRHIATPPIPNAWCVIIRTQCGVFRRAAKQCCNGGCKRDHYWLTLTSQRARTTNCLLSLHCNCIKPGSERRPHFGFSLWLQICFCSRLPTVAGSKPDIDN